MLAASHYLRDRLLHQLNFPTGGCEAHPSLSLFLEPNSLLCFSKEVYTQYAHGIAAVSLPAWPDALNCQFVVLGSIERSFSSLFFIIHCLAGEFGTLGSVSASLKIAPFILHWITGEERLFINEHLDAVVPLVKRGI